MDIPAGGTRKNLRFRRTPTISSVRARPSSTKTATRSSTRPTPSARTGKRSIGRAASSWPTTTKITSRSADPHPARRRLHHLALYPQPGGPAARLRGRSRRRTALASRASTVTRSCHTGPQAPLQALRICENSSERGGVIACMLREALATAIVGPAPTAPTFACPMPRVPNELGGSTGTSPRRSCPPTRPARLRARSFRSGVSAH